MAFVGPGRFYLAGVVPTNTVGAFKGSWDKTATTQRKLGRTKEGSTGYGRSSEGSALVDYDVCLARAVTDQIPYSRVISGSFSYALGFAEQAAEADYYVRIHVYVTAGLTDTVRGTLLNQHVGPDELPITTALGMAESGLVMSTVAAQAGDRIVAEIGYRSKNTHTTYYTGQLNWGGTGATDLTAGGTPDTQPGWIEFSEDPWTPTVLLVGVAPTVAVGTLTLAPGNVALALSGIPSGAQVGTLTLFVGDPALVLTGIPSTAQIGTLALVPGNRNLVLSGIPSGVPPSVSIGTLSLVPGEVILALAGIASTAKTGTPTFKIPFVPLQIALSLLEMPLILIKSENASDGTESSGVILLALTEMDATLAVNDRVRGTALSEMPLTLEWEVLNTELEVT